MTDYASAGEYGRAGSVRELEQMVREQRGADGGFDLPGMVAAGERIGQTVASNSMVRAAKQLEAAVGKASASLRNAEPTNEYNLDRTGTKSYRSAFMSALRGTATPEQRSELRFGEHRDLSLGTNSAGGYTVPHDFYETLVTSQAWAGAIRSVATTITTDDGRTIDVPITDASSQAASLLTENSTVNEATDPVFSTVALHAYPVVAPAILTPWALIRDRSFLPAGVTPLADSVHQFASATPHHVPQPLDIMQVVADIGGLRLSLGEEPLFATGTGSSQPLGVIPGTTTGVTTASNAAITWVEIVKLWASVNAVYRANAVWMMNTATAATLMELEDSAGAPLFNAAWGPFKILGCNVIVNDQFPNIGSATSPIVFGDFRRGYFVRTAGVVGIPLVERFADALLSALLVYERVDGCVADGLALRKLTMHV